MKVLVLRIIGSLFMYLFTYVGWLRGNQTVGQAVTNQLLETVFVNTLSKDKGGSIIQSVFDVVLLMCFTIMASYQIMAIR